MKTNLIDYPQQKGMMLYHASSHQFSFPSWDEIDKEKIGCEKRILGLWATGHPNLKGFGKYCYQIEMSDNTRLKGLDLKHLMDFHYDESTEVEPLERYKSLRKLWQSEADVVFLLDSNPEIGEVIIMNFEKIRNFSLVK